MDGPFAGQGKGEQAADLLQGLQADRGARRGRRGVEEKHTQTFGAEHQRHDVVAVLGHVRPAVFVAVIAEAAIGNDDFAGLGGASAEAAAERQALLVGEELAGEIAAGGVQVQFAGFGGAQEDPALALDDQVAHGENGLERQGEAFGEWSAGVLEDAGDGVFGFCPLAGIGFRFFMQFALGDVGGGAAITEEAAVSRDHRHAADAEPLGFAARYRHPVFETVEGAVRLEVGDMAFHCRAVAGIDDGHDLPAGPAERPGQIETEQFAGILREEREAQVGIHFPEPPVRTGRENIEKALFVGGQGCMGHLQLLFDRRQPAGERQIQQQGEQAGSGDEEGELSEGGLTARCVVAQEEQ